MAIISPGQTAFLKFEIENGDARRRKVALQDLSRRYRNGDKLNAEGRNSFEKTINGIVLSDSDRKVVRWCLNALARLGTRQGSSKYVVAAMRQYEEEPEIVAAAIAALSHMYHGTLDAVPELAVLDPSIRILAAMQTTNVNKLNISNLTIDIEKADKEVLKLALLVVGLNRDIQNLLHPRHSNGAIVRQLGQHDDPIVRQYSVWSVMENRRLTLADLGIPFDTIGTQPANVQAKLLQLAAERETDPRVRHQIIHEGTFNDFPEARLGLAKGLVHSYYEGLEDLTIRWYDVEENLDVLGLVAEHFARFSDDCGPYFEKALEIIEASPKLTDRILLGAEGKELYGKIKGLDRSNGTGDLFGTPSDLAAMFQKSTEILRKAPLMKVLFLAANPLDEGRLKIDQEASDLKEQLALVRDTKIAVDVEHAWAIRTDQLQREVLNAKPDVLHFSGHGDTGMLIFEDATGNGVEVSGEALAGLIELMPTIKCVVLNACFSDSVSKLVAPYVEAVIGCDVSIGDTAAILFTRAFYRALAHGNSFQRSFDLAKNDLNLNGQGKEAGKYTISCRS
ncbi:CHAT domain-containing protein [Pseudorhizobium marinum]|uniref:CHAT domain-containing protein n=1 Tax=Pseudorhizobium marinum TaxID=1496690 RepID=UPI000690A495|nr:CHAT domain-containing protein [Pseudorhizobium marinum]